MADIMQAVWQSTLRQLAERDGAVEICAVGLGEHRVGTTFKTRVFAIETSGALLLEMPHHAHANEQLVSGAEIEALVVAGTQRLTGRCIVAGMTAYTLSSGTRTRALRLSAAVGIKSAQRRRFFRVLTVGVDTGPVTLIPRPQAGQTRGQMMKHRVRGHLLNIGGGGVGISADNVEQLAEMLRASTKLAALIPLPDEPDPLEVNVSLVHVHPMAGNAVYLGLQFDFADPAEQHRVEDRIQRVSADLQRANLRRQRGA